MIVDCIHGFYKFVPENLGDIAIWQDYNEKELVSAGEYYTFKSLAEMPNYSFIGGTYAGNPLIVNYSGEQSEVLRQNNLIYDYDKDTFMSKYLMFAQLNYDDDLYPNTPILPQAGTIRGLQRMVGFSGFWDYKFNIYKILRFDYESVLG